MRDRPKTDRWQLESDQDSCDMRDCLLNLIGFLLFLCVMLPLFLFVRAHAKYKSSSKYVTFTRYIFWTEYYIAI